MQNSKPIQAFISTITLIMVCFLSTQISLSQERKKEDKRFRSTIIELTDKAPNDWLLKELKVGAKMISDRDYTISDLPSELKGSTLLQRHSGDFKNWLMGGSLTALKDGSVYIMMRTKFLKKEEVGEVALTKLEREGWKEVEGEAATTFPSGEDWQWKVYKKAIKKGEVVLQLKTLNWNGPAILFCFK